MLERPPVGSRVSIRYRANDGAHTDVIGRLAELTSRVQVSNNDGVVDIAAAEVVSIRELSAAPVRNSEIRALEHAAALGWPGTEQHWHSGWLLRAAGGPMIGANSAVPLNFASSISDIAEIVDWYGGRNLTPWLALPQRLLPVRAEGVTQTRVLVRGIEAADTHRTVALVDAPDATWLACYRRNVPVEALTAVLDGEVVFASIADTAVGRGVITTAPDGTRWLGISALNVTAGARWAGHGRVLSEALQNWGIERGAQRVYTRVAAENTAAGALYTSLGFGLHHHMRYVDARHLLSPGREPN